MSSGFGGSDLNQLKDKDDIEDDDDPVNLVGTRSSDPSDAPLIPEEMQYLSANQRPGGLLPSKDATKILPPMAGRPHALGGGPQPGNNLHIYGNMPRKRSFLRSAAPGGSEDTRPSKQAKLSVMEMPSVDTDDECMDDPYNRGDNPIQRQEFRKPKEITTRLSSGLLQGSRQFKPRQMNTGPEQQNNRKNGAIDYGRLAESKNMGRADSDFLRDLDDIPTGRRQTQSTHAGALQNNNSSRWNSSSSRDGDIKPTKWTGGNTKKKNTIPQQQRRISGSSTTRLNLLCFQHGIHSHSIGGNVQSLFVEAVPGKRLTVFCGEKQEESKIWDIDLEDIRSIKSVHVNTLKKVFAIRLGPRSLGESEANRVVVFTLKNNGDVDQCKTKLFRESAKFTPKEEEEKFFDRIANSLGDWKGREAAESHRLALGGATVSRQQNSHQMNAQGHAQTKVRRSTRNKANKTEALEVLPSKRDSPTDKFGDSPGSSEIPKLELPKPRWETSLVYPPTGPKREVIDYDDLSRLNSNQFLNDNIVNFYLRYIEVQLQKRNPGLAKETYFLNTFFYERLTKRDEKGKRREIGSVLKWTAKVDIFKTSYIVVPINESSHWYLAVICNLCHLERKMKDKVPDSPESKPIDLEFNRTLAEVSEDDMALSNTLDAEVITESPITRSGEGQGVEILSLQNSPEHMAIDEERPNEVGLHREVIELDGSPSQRLKSKGGGKTKVKEKSPQNRRNYIAPDAPAIIILDSMGFGTSARAGTIKNLREYLVAEAQNKRNLEITKDDIKATYAKAPNQNNWYDCGLFLLHYVERFLDRPKEFAAMLLAKEVNMRDQELWRTEDIGGMREKLFHLFVKLHEEQDAIEIEQRSLKKPDCVNANDVKGQKIGNRKGPAKDVMTVDADGSTNDYGMRKILIDPELAVASEGNLVNGGDWRMEENNAPTKLVTQVIGEFKMQLEDGEEMVVEEVSNSMLQHREVTLSVRNNQ